MPNTSENPPVSAEEPSPTLLEPDTAGGVTREVGEFKEAFEQARVPMEALVAQLAEGIKGGRWASIVIEGRSAILPGMEVGGLMQQMARDSNMPEPPMLYVPSIRKLDVGQDDPDEEKSQFIKKRIDAVSPELGARTLVFTEFIAGGKAVNRVASALQIRGTGFDVAAVQNMNRLSSEQLGQALREEYPGTFSDSEVFTGDPCACDRVAFLDPLLQATGVAAGIGTGLVDINEVPSVGYIDTSTVLAAFREIRDSIESLYQRHLA